MRPEAEHSFVLRKIWRWDVALLVIVFVHADKLICKRDRVRREGKICRER